MWAFGGEDCHVEFWDPRSRKRLGRHNAGLPIVAKYGMDSFSKGAPEVSSLCFHSDGLSYAVGTSSGHVSLYDLRSTSPVLVKDHQSEYPIKKLEFLHNSDNIMTADAKVLKIWNRKTVLDLIKI